MALRIFLSSLLFIAQGYDVSAQCRSRVEFVSPPATLSTTSYIQPTGKCVIPAVITPLVDKTNLPANERSEPPSVPSYSDYNCNKFPIYPMYQPSVPTYCVDAGDDDDEIRTLLYFLIYALKNKSRGFEGYNGGCGCGCGCNCGYGGGCGCGCCGFGGDYGCDGYGYGGGCCGDFGYFGCDCQNRFFDLFTGNGVTFIPYPIIVPSNGGTSCDTNSNNVNHNQNENNNVPVQAFYKDANEITIILTPEESCPNK